MGRFRRLRGEEVTLLHRIPHVVIRAVNPSFALDPSYGLKSALSYLIAIGGGIDGDTLQPYLTSTSNIRELEIETPASLFGPRYPLSPRCPEYEDTLQLLNVVLEHMPIFTSIPKIQFSLVGENGFPNRWLQFRPEDEEDVLEAIAGDYADAFVHHFPILRMGRPGISVFCPPICNHPTFGTRVSISSDDFIQAVANVPSP